MPLPISINWPSLVTLWVVVQKIYSKIHPVSCTNTHHDVTDLVNHGIVKNTKTWISWKLKLFFLRNKKILNFCLRWHIFRCYRFLAEVTFKYKGCECCLEYTNINDDLMLYKCLYCTRNYHNKFNKNLNLLIHTNFLTMTSIKFFCCCKKVFTQMNTCTWMTEQNSMKHY